MGGMLLRGIITTIMRGRKLVYETVADMSAAVKELSFEAHRFQDCLAAILASACGGDGEKGLLETRTAEYAANSPLEWARELDELCELLGPNSFLLKKVADCANNQMAIDVPMSSPSPPYYPGASPMSSPSPAPTNRGWWGDCAERLLVI